MSYVNTPFVLNGVSYSDGRFAINGIDLPGIRGLNLTVEMEKTNKFGAGVYPVARGRGVKDLTGSIDLDIETRNILMSAFAIPTELTDMPPFNLTAIFDNGVELIKVVATAVEFKSDGIETSQGDDEIVRSYDIVGGILNVFR
jgi:hypothetical protein